MGIWVGQLGFRVLFLVRQNIQFVLRILSRAMPYFGLRKDANISFVLSFFLVYVCVMGQSEYYGIHMEWLVLCLSIVGKIF